MVKRNVNCSKEEPKQNDFKLPSEGVEFLFQVIDFVGSNDENIVICKLEVVEGDEVGRSLLHRVSLNEEWKGFFATRLFLKAIGEPYKGDGVNIDSDNWIGRRFYATVIHNVATNKKTYANIDTYNFEKKIEQTVANPGGVTEPKDMNIAWED